jgi:hypothetical protein
VTTGDPTQETTEEPLAQDADAAPYTDEDDDSRDDDGNLIDPPTIPSHERELQEASASGDNDAVAAAQEKYTQARKITSAQPGNVRGGTVSEQGQSHVHARRGGRHRRPLRICERAARGGGRIVRNGCNACNA